MDVDEGLLLKRDDVHVWCAEECKVGWECVDVVDEKEEE